MMVNRRKEVLVLQQLISGQLITTGMTVHWIDKDTLKSCKAAIAG